MAINDSIRRINMNQQYNGGRDADFDDHYGDYGFVSHRDPGLGIFNVNFIRSPGHNRGYSVIDALKICINKLFIIRGRACRSEFWWYMLVVWILVIPLIPHLLTNNIVVMIIEYVLNISVVAVAVRRLHDKDRSGLWVLPVFIPYLGFLYTLLLMFCFCFRGTPKANKYGVDPLA